MKAIQVLFSISDDFELKNATISYNDTGLPSDKELLKGLAEAILTDINIGQALDETKNIIDKKDNK